MNEIKWILLSMGFVVFGLMVSGWMARHFVTLW